MGDSPYACNGPLLRSSLCEARRAGPSWDQVRTYFLKNLNVELDNTVLECVDYYMSTNGDRHEKYPFGSDAGFYLTCDISLKEIQELITSVKNPPKPTCPSCDGSNNFVVGTRSSPALRASQSELRSSGNNSVVGTRSGVDFTIICDNDCQTLFCSDCSQEFYFNFGAYEYGHDPNCGIME